MNLKKHTSDNLLCSNSSPILKLSVKCASQICNENINKPLDGAYLADFGIDITKRTCFTSDNCTGEAVQGMYAFRSKGLISSYLFK